MSGKEEGNGYDIPVLDQSNDGGSNIDRYNSILKKPKIPAPDFKLRESRKKRIHHITDRSNIILSVRQNSKPQLNSINNLIKNISNERISINQSKIQTNQNRKNNPILDLKCSALETNSCNNIIKDTVHLSNRSSDSSVTYKSTILDSSETVNIRYNTTGHCRNKVSENKKSLSYVKRNLSSFNKTYSKNFINYNFDLFKYYWNRESEVKLKNKTKKLKNKTSDHKKSSVNANDKLTTKNKNSKSDLTKKSSNSSKFTPEKHPSNTPVQCEETFSTTSLKKLGFAFIHGTKELNKRISNVYTCIINKIDECLQFKTYITFQNSNLITSNHSHDILLYKIKKADFQLTFSRK